MATIRVTFTIEEFIDIDIADGSLTAQEIHDLCNEKAAEILPGYEDFDWEWHGREPIAKGFSSTPPDDWWIDTAIGKIATTGAFLVTAEFPIQDLKIEPVLWYSPESVTEKFIGEVESLCAIELATMLPHSGCFSKKFKTLCDIPGLYALEDPKNKSKTGYLVIGDRLVGLLAPAICDANNILNPNIFRFPDTIESREAIASLRS